MTTKKDAKELLSAFLATAPQEYGLDWTLATEHRFHPVRRWRFDWVWMNADGEPTMIALEFDGIMSFGGHSSITGIMRDQEKINEAQLLGWDVYRCNVKSVENGSFQNFMRNVLTERARVGE